MDLGRPPDMPPVKHRLRTLVEDEGMEVGEAAWQMLEEGYEGHHIWMKAVDELYPEYRDG